LSGSANGQHHRQLLRPVNPHTQMTQAVRDSVNPSSCFIVSRITNFWTLPVIVGNYSGQI